MGSISKMRNVGSKGSRGFVGAVLVVLLAGATGVSAAPPPPPSITLNSVTPFLDSGSGECKFTLNYTVNGLKGKPSLQWGVGTLVPVHIFPGGGSAGLGSVTKADNGIPQNGVPNLTHPNDGHTTDAWYAYLVHNRWSQVIALSGSLSVNSTC